MSSVAGFPGNALVPGNTWVRNIGQAVPGVGSNVATGFRSHRLEHIDPTGVGIARIQTCSRGRPCRAFGRGARERAGRAEQFAKTRGLGDKNPATRYLRKDHLAQKCLFATCFMNRTREDFVNADHRLRDAEVAPGTLLAAAGLKEIRRCRLEDAEGPACVTFAQDRGFGRGGHYKRALEVQLLP